MLGSCIERASDHTCFQSRLADLTNLLMSYAPTQDRGAQIAWLAEKMDVSRATVYRWSNGDVKRVNVNNFKAIADFLKTSPQIIEEYLKGEITLEKLLVFRNQSFYKIETEILDRVNELDTDKLLDLVLKLFYQYQKRTIPDSELINPIYTLLKSHLDKSGITGSIERQWNYLSEYIPLWEKDDVSRFKDFLLKKRAILSDLELVAIAQSQLFASPIDYANLKEMQARFIRDMGSNFCR